MIINEFLTNHSIYFLQMNYKRYGMTLFDGTIVINKIYYGPTYIQESAFIILWTLLHEMMHILSRLLRGDNNFFLDENLQNPIKNNRKKVENILKINY